MLRDLSRQQIPFFFFLVFVVFTCSNIHLSPKTIKSNSLKTCLGMFKAAPDMKSINNTTNAKRKATCVEYQKTDLSVSSVLSLDILCHLSLSDGFGGEVSVPSAMIGAIGNGFWIKLLDSSFKEALHKHWMLLIIHLIMSNDGIKTAIQDRIT